MCEDEIIILSYVLGRLFMQTWIFPIIYETDLYISIVLCFTNYV